MHSFRVMSVSLVMMLAALSYCKINLVCVLNILADTSALIFSPYAKSFPPRENLSHLSISVYKLVRFYQPGPAEQYETTRATLTVFSKPHFQCIAKCLTLPIFI